MFGSPRIKLDSLAALSRRLSIGLGAGVDIRKVWAREIDRSRGAERQNFEEISAAVNRGQSLSEAVDACGDYFPELFRGMMHVGDHSGHQAEVLRQLADQYDHRIKLRRAFINAIWWPMFQLVIAIGVIGLLILVMGMIAPQKPGQPPPIDPLGFGLVGERGLVIYLMIVGGVAGAIALMVRAILRGALWVRPVQRVLLRVPKLGRAFQTLALSRMAWTLYVTQGAGMGLKESLAQSLKATRNAEYAETADAAWQSIRRGSDLHAALASTAEYPRDFLDTIEVGEQSGRLVESLGRLADQYEDEARRAMEMITQMIGFLVWALVGMFIVVMIFRLFGFYLNAIQEASKI